MSLLVQAKREAKRLLKLSQENNSAIQIKSLSEARKYYAAMKGYHNWHDYEENLKRQDFIKGITPSNNKPSLDIENDELDYYLQDSEFMVHLMEKNEQKLNVIENKPHTPTILGETKNKKRFKTEEKWLLRDYPCTIVGSTGSGRTESWLSQAQQWIVNGEGFIGLDGYGYIGTFNKIFSIASQVNRLKDIHILNLLNSHEHDMKISNSFDIINPLIGNENLFKNLYGNEIGLVIHEIALQVKLNNMVIDSENIKSILMIKNLIDWESNSIFGDKATKTISNYLKNILNLNNNWNDLNEDEQEDILFKHLELCKKAKNAIEVIRYYEDLGVFSKNPEINLKEIFLNRKILFVLFPSLEKSWDIMNVLTNSIYAQIWKIASDIEDEMNYQSCFLQNIVLDNVSYCMSSDLADLTFKKLPKNSNFTFTFTEFSSYNNNNAITHALAVSKTIILMKIEDPYLIPLTLKGRIVENVQNNLSALYKGNRDIREQHEGQAYVYIESDESRVESLSYVYHFDNKSLDYCSNNGNKSKLFYKDFINIKKGAYFENLKLTYLVPKNKINITINNFKIDNKIKSFPLSELNHK